MSARRSTFRLAAVLRVRRLQEGLARNAVGAATVAASAAEESALACERRVHALGGPTAGTGRDLAGEAAGRLALARDSAEARAAATHAAGAVDDAIRWWAEAAGRTRPLERLAETHAAAVRAAEDAAAQTVMDDLAAAAWQRRRRPLTPTPTETSDQEAPCPA